MFDTRPLSRTLLAIGTLIITACSSGGSGAASPEPTAETREAPTRVAARTVYVGVNCGTSGPQPGVTWIGDPGARQRLVQRLEDNALGEPGSLPTVDFRSHGLIFIEMGRRATTGYSLELASPRVLIRPNGHARMEIRARRPASGTVTSPMLTYPCLVARVPRAGFDRLEVVDDEGRSWDTARVD